MDFVVCVLWCEFVVMLIWYEYCVFFQFVMCFVVVGVWVLLLVVVGVFILMFLWFWLIVLWFFGEYVLGFFCYCNMVWVGQFVSVLLVFYQLVFDDVLYNLVCGVLLWSRDDSICLCFVELFLWVVIFFVVFWEVGFDVVLVVDLVWIYGDLYLGNILVDGDCFVVFVDFGDVIVGDFVYDFVVGWFVFDVEG